MLSTHDRPALKAAAKESLRSANSRGVPVTLVTVVYLLMVLVPAVISGLQYRAVTTQLLPQLQMMNPSSPEEAMELLSMMRGYSASGGYSLAMLLLSIVLAVVGVGYQLYTLRISRGEDPGSVGALFDPFRQFGRFFVVLLLQGLFPFLWYLAGLIPGIILIVIGAASELPGLSILGGLLFFAGFILFIIAVYSYSQAVYFALDNPDMSATNTLRASKQAMRGHKWEYFVLELSFLGWAILTGLTFGILSIWVYPYQFTTFANYYNALTGWQPAAEGAETAPAAAGAPEKEPEWWEK